MRSTVEQKLSTISTFPKIGSTISSYINDVADEFSKMRKLNAKRYIILYAYKEVTNIAVITTVSTKNKIMARFFKVIHNTLPAFIRLQKGCFFPPILRTLPTQLQLIHLMILPLQFHQLTMIPTLNNLPTI